MIAIFFRGRNTANTIADFEKHFGKPSNTYVISYDGDSLRQDGDILKFPYEVFTKSGNIVIIANGGTTKQLVPIVGYIAGYAEGDDSYNWDDVPEGYDEPRKWRYSILDVQKDKCEFLYGDSIPVN